VALDRSGALTAWGANHRGQLGVATDVRTSERALAVVGVPAAARVRAGNAHTVVLAVDGGVWAFGDNRYGQLARLDPAYTAVAGKVRLAQAAVDVASGGAHVLSLSADGQVHGWGSNESLQLGLDGVRAAVKPVPLAASAPARAIAARGASSAILLADGSVLVYGGGRRSTACCWPQATRIELTEHGLVLHPAAGEPVHLAAMAATASQRGCASP
jgi:alpha-tubulin suppressor-like RCC1 family protein